MNSVQGSSEKSFSTLRKLDMAKRAAPDHPAGKTMKNNGAGIHLAQKDELNEVLDENIPKDSMADEVEKEQTEAASESNTVPSDSATVPEETPPSAGDATSGTASEASTGASPEASAASSAGEASAASSAGEASAAAAGSAGAGMSIGTLGLAAAAIGVAGIAVAVGGGGGGGGGSSGGGSSASGGTGFTLTGGVVAGSVVANSGLSVDAFKADGTKLAGGSATVDNSGKFTMTITENYTGPVLLRVQDTTAGADYIDEGTGVAKDLSIDLRAVTNISGNGTVTLNVTPLTELAVRQLVGDAGGDGGSATTLLGGTVTTSAVAAANNVIKDAFGLADDITSTLPVSVDNSGFSSGSTAQQAYGRALAAISGAEANASADMGKILNTIVQGLTSSTLSQSTVDLLVAGATKADSIGTNTGGSATALKTIIGSNISSIAISADTGSADFITQTAAQTITAQLDSALSGTKLWGSVDGGKTWTDISASVTATALSWSGVTLADTNTIKLAVTANTVVGFTGSTSSVIGKITVQAYSIDTTSPSFTSAATSNFAENGTGTVYKAVATDARLVTYTMSGTDAALFNIDASSGVVTFKSAPNYESPTDSGANNVYDISVTATDGANNSSTLAVAISVTNVNEAPSVTSGATASFAENGTGTVYTATATDPDASTTFAYSLSGTDSALFSIDTSTGVVTFKNAPNFEAPADSGANNVYDINVIASDGALTATQAVAITVTGVNEAPSFTSAATASFAENGTGTVYTAAATDPDASTTLVYSLGGTDAAKFAIDANTGVVTFAAAPNYEVPTDSGTNNDYDITVTASDGSLSATKSVVISVTNVNEAPTSTTITASSAVVNQAYTFNPSTNFTDVDANNVFTYTQTGLPTGLSINSATGVISGTATTESLTNSVTVTATDNGGLSTSQTFNLPVVSAPVITGITANVAQAKSGDALTFTVKISEAVTITGGTPTLTFNVGGQSMTATYTSGSNSNTLTFTATTSTGDSSAVTVTGISLGGATITGNVSSQAFVTTSTGQVVSSFVIDNSNPAFTSSATASFAENDTGTAYTTVATDATAITYTLGGTDATLFNISSAGLVTFKSAPNYEAPTDNGANNVYDITITATDALNHTSSTNVAITVTNVNETPTSTTITPASVAVNQAYSLNVSSNFSDVDANNTFTYTQTGLPTGLSINSSTGVISGTVTTASATNSVTVTATDSGGLTTSQTFNLPVVTAPSITNLSTIDNVTNVDVKTDLVLKFSDTIQLGSGTIKIMDDMGTSGLSITNSTTSETTTEKTDNDVVITIANGVVTGLTIGSVDKSAEMSNSAKVSGNILTISPAGSDSESNTDWDFDFDFGSNYHVEMSAGVVTSNGVGNVAISDSTTLNFTTVTPVATATGVPSSKMAADGTLADSYIWHHGHVQDSTSTGLSMNFSAGSHALMVLGNGLNNSGNALATTMGGKVQLTGLGADDIIYNDNVGNMSLQTLDGLNKAQYQNTGNLTSRELDNTVGSGGGHSTVFADYSSTGYSQVTQFNGGDNLLEDANHYNANIFVFG